MKTISYLAFGAILTVHEMTRFVGSVPCAMTLLGFLYGTSSSVLQINECSEGGDRPILLRAKTRNVKLAHGVSGN